MYIQLIQIQISINDKRCSWECHPYTILLFLYKIYNTHYTYNVFISFYSANLYEFVMDENNLDFKQTLQFYIRFRVREKKVKFIFRKRIIAILHTRTSHWLQYVRNIMLDYYYHYHRCTYYISDSDFDVNGIYLYKFDFDLFGFINEKFTVKEFILIIIINLHSFHFI